MWRGKSTNTSGIPPSFTAVGHYIRSGQLQLPCTSVVEEFKVAKCRVSMILRDSRTSNPVFVDQMGPSVTWSKLWRLQPFRIGFLLRSVYNTLPSPANLARWGLREDPLCKLYGRKGTLAPTSWLGVTQPRPREGISGGTTRCSQSWQISWSRPGKGHDTVALDPGRGTTNILQKAQGWEMRADLGRKLSLLLSRHH